MVIYDPISIALRLPPMHIQYNYMEYLSDAFRKPTSPINKGIPMSEDQKRKLSIINSGKTLSEEHKRKIGIATKERRIRQPHPVMQVSNETREKMRQAQLGKYVSNETREKMSQAKLGKKKLQKICPHCNLAIAPNMYKRWHDNNCKKNYKCLKSKI